MKQIKDLSRRGLALLLTLVMCVGLLNLTAFAAVEEPVNSSVVVDREIAGTDIGDLGEVGEIGIIKPEADSDVSGGLIGGSDLEIGGKVDLGGEIALPMAKSITVWYYLNFNGDTSTTKNKDVSTSGSITIQAAPDEWYEIAAGCTFKGWAISATNTTPKYQVGDTIKASSRNTTYSLYALWEAPATAEESVAEINGTYYTTLEKAFYAAESGDTIVLLSDLDNVQEAIPNSNTITLDLRGHTLSKGSASGYGVLNVQKSNLTITGGGTIDGGSSMAIYNPSGTLTLKNVTVTSSVTDADIFGAAVVTNTTSDSYRARTTIANGAVVDSVKVMGNQDCTSSVKIEGGAVGTVAVSNEGNRKITCTITGGHFATDVSAYVVNGYHWISCSHVAGCQYEVHQLTENYTNNGDGSTHSIKCADCSEVIKTENHEFVDGKCVCGAVETVTVAMIRETGAVYATLQEALDVAKAAFNGGKNGSTTQTVILLSDTQESVSISVVPLAGKVDFNLTIDLNGKTLTGKDGSVITIGELTSYAANVTLTITDSSAEKTGTITGGNTTGNGGAIYVNKGHTCLKIVIDGGNFVGNTAAGDGGAIWSVYQSNASVTINGGTFTGNTATNGGAICARTVNMNGGTITGNTATSAGGGIYAYCGYVGNSEISNGKIYGNTASEYGADIVFGGSTKSGMDSTKLLDAASMGVSGVNAWLVDEADNRAGDSFCVVCASGTVKTAQNEVVALKAGMKAEHDLVNVPEIPATCTEDGVTAGIKCSVCGEIQEGCTVIPATGHTPGTPVEENRVEATFDKEGSYDEVIYCTECGKEISREAKTIAKKIAVASIGETMYESLQAAIKAANAGETVVLLKSIAETVAVSPEKDIVLELNGCTLSNGSYDITVQNQGTLTIKDSSEAQTGTIVSYAADDAIDNYATLNVESGTIQGGTAWYGIYAGNNSVTNVYGTAKVIGTYWGIAAAGAAEAGTQINVYGDAEVWSTDPAGTNGGISASKATTNIYGNANVHGACGINTNGKLTVSGNATITAEYAASGSAIGAWVGADVTVEGGTIKGGAYGISGNGSSDGTTLTVNGGAITGKGAGIYHPQDGILTITGGTITGAVGVQMCDGDLIVSGGEITGNGGDEREGKTSDGAIIDGAAISLVQRGGGYGTPTAEITGGLFTSEQTDAVMTYAWSNDAQSEWTISKFISGGTFSNDVPAGYVADGYASHPVSAPEGYYNVHEPQTEWFYDETNHWQGCTVENCLSREDGEDHSYDGVVTTEPQIGVAGVRTFTCTVCGHSYTEAVDALTAPPTTYTVTYRWTGLPAGAGQTLPQTRSYVAGGSVKVDTLYTEGMEVTVGETTYVFSGWDTEDFRINANTTISGAWTEKAEELVEPEQPEEPDPTEPDPTEPEEPGEELEDPNVPLGEDPTEPDPADPEEPGEELEDPNVPLGEDPTEPDPADPEEPGEELVDPNAPLDESPETGDSTRIALWSGALLASGLGMIALLGKKKEEEEEA